MGVHPGTQSLWLEYQRTRDKAVRDRLILTYAPLVKYVAGRLGSGLPAHIDEGDLISYGLLGLIGAIDRFDPTLDIKFETYAMARIRGSIIDELRSLDWVPRSVRTRAREIERAIRELEARLERAPTDLEIASKVGISEDELEESLTNISRSSIAALDELWSVSGRAEIRSRCWTRSRIPAGRSPPTRSTRPRRVRSWPMRSRGCRNARSSSSRSTTTRSSRCARSERCWASPNRASRSCTRRRCCA